MTNTGTQMTPKTIIQIAKVATPRKAPTSDRTASLKITSGLKVADGA